MGSEGEKFYNIDYTKIFNNDFTSEVGSSLTDSDISDIIEDSIIESSTQISNDESKTTPTKENDNDVKSSKLIFKPSKSVITPFENSDYYELRSVYTELVDYSPKNAPIIIEEKDVKIDAKMVLKSLEYFLKQHFSKSTPLTRSESEKITSPYGNDSWNIRSLVTHKVSKQYNAMINDRYLLTTSTGHSAQIPLSFYFDLSGSMSQYTSLLVKMIDAILSNDVAVLYGYNQYIHGMLNDETKYKSLDELKKIISSECEKLKIKDGILDKYLIEHEAEKVVVFSDYDPFDEVINLSKSCFVYWFCFENRSGNGRNIDLFKGRFFHTTDFADFSKHVNNVDDINYENRQRILQKTKFDRGTLR